IYRDHMNSELIKISEQKPRIQQYLDLRKFLLAFYQWRKTSEAGFSYSQWAGELGFKSRSFLRLVVTGKRSITEKSIPLFVRGLNFNRTEADYFERLVRFSQAETLEHQEYRLQDLLQGRGTTFERTLVKDHHLLISSPLGPRLQVLLTLTDVKKTANNLAWLLGTTVEEVTPLLQSLERLGLASRGVNSAGIESWNASMNGIEVPEQLGNLSLQSYHRRSLEEAVEALSFPVETRAYQSAIFPLSEEEYGQFRKEMTGFLETMLGRYSSDCGEGRRIYQINLNVIPVSQPILRERIAASAPVGDLTNETHHSNLELGSIEN
ncbi:MAG: TIGR02147 family protein, partial [Pseudobdellovibrionaceae bacterium]